MKKNQRSTHTAKRREVEIISKKLVDRGQTLSESLLKRLIIRDILLLLKLLSFDLTLFKKGM